MTEPFVSILIPCFNAEKWIAEAIESALQQTCSGKEVLVVDDGSEDDSLRAIQSFGHRIRWETGPNRGGNVARNRLLELARGDWLQYLDADDYLLPNKVEQQVSFVQAHPSADVVFSPVTLEYWTGDQVRWERQIIPTPHDPWILLARWKLPQTGGCLWKKSAILDVGGWKAEQPCCQEHELYLRLLTGNRQFAYCDAYGAVYRQWSTTTVSTKSVPKTIRHRLQIELALRSALIASGQLTRERQLVINEVLFELGRAAWCNGSRELAVEIVDGLTDLVPEFAPTRERRLYHVMWKLIGFRNAERLAEWRRRIANVQQR